MNTGIMGITSRREPMQWVGGKFVVVKQKAKKKPSSSRADSKLLATVTTPDKGGETDATGR